MVRRVRRKAHARCGGGERAEIISKPYLFLSFKGAIRRGAASIIFAHNHPSGIVDPSPEDISVTERLMEVGKLIGIEVLDHVIVGSDNYYSLKGEGLLHERL